MLGHTAVMAMRHCYGEYLSHAVTHDDICIDASWCVSDETSHRSGIN